MKVCAIMATAGRHTLSERSLRFFLDQNYKENHTLLIYNNSLVSQRLSIEGSKSWSEQVKGGEATEARLDFGGGKKVHLINQYVDSKTGDPYTTLGGIYNDILPHILDEGVDIIIHWDDDDIFLPNHISEGMKGYYRALKEGKIAYKPEKSYYRHPGGIELMGNNLEPSVFVPIAHIQKHGYSLTTSDQHMPWFNALLSENLMLVDPKGPPTLIYNWGDTEIPTFKTSGNHGHPNNFQNYRNFSKDHGDQVISPWSSESVQKYYNLVQ